MAKKTTKDELARLQELEDLRRVMATGPGFRLLKRLINFTGPLQMFFNRDHATHAFFDGGRNVGNKIVKDMLEASPELAMRVLMETCGTINDEEKKDETHNVEKDDEPLID